MSPREGTHGQTLQPGQEPVNPSTGGKQRADANSVYRTGFQAPTGQGAKPRPPLSRELFSLHWAQNARPGRATLGSGPPAPRGRKWLPKGLPAGTALQDACHPGKREVPLGSQLHSRQAPPGRHARPRLGTERRAPRAGAGRPASPAAGTGACLRPRAAWNRWAGQVCKAPGVRGRSAVGLSHLLLPLFGPQSNGSAACQALGQMPGTRCEACPCSGAGHGLTGEPII